LILKKGKRSWCFYDSENPQKIEFSAMNYQKLFPSDMRYISIRNKNAELSFNGEHLKIMKTEFGREVRLNKKIWRIYFQEKNGSNELDYSVFMPWITHPNSLKNGAKIYEIAQN
jgi:hypothetical protein